MSEEIAEVVGAIAAAFVATILIDMWLGGGLLSGLNPSNFPGGMPNTTSAGNATAAPQSQSATGEGTTTGGIASAPI